MSTPHNHLSELTPEFRASRGSSVYDQKTGEPLRNEYNRRVVMLSLPYTLGRYDPHLTNVPEKYSPSITLPTLRKDVGDDMDDSPDDSLCAFGDKVGELAWEYWLQKNDYWRWKKLSTAHPVTPWLLPTTAVCEIPAFPRFLELPFEIREMIYEHALRDGSHFDTPFQLTAPFTKPRRFQVSPQAIDNSSRPRRLQLPAVCLTSRLEYNIATRVLVRGKVVHLRADGDASAMEKFLTSITSDPSLALTPIRRADVVYQTRHRNKGIYRETWLVKDFMFLSKCSQLREVTITIPVEHWFDTPRLETPEPRRLKPEELGDKFGLALLRSCAMLRRLTLVSLPTWYLNTLQDWTVEETLEDLAALARWVKGNALPGHRKNLSTKLVYTNGIKVPFLTTNDEVACDWADVKVGWMRAFVLELMA